MVIGLIGAVCGAGVSKQAADHVAFPGPSELRADPSLTVLVDSASGDSLLVLGTQLTFSELREKLVPKLEANGWTVTHPVPNPRAQITDDDVIGAQKGGDCIAYWNMNQGAWAAPSMRRDAARRSPAFERQSAAYATVFAVYLIECP
ncbi:MAG: hypothetical protein KGK07_16235 [Chloroflexota bacterium]|nr:hypothetical protein [Chloroflexota bacterium]